MAKPLSILEDSVCTLPEIVHDLVDMGRTYIIDRVRTETHDLAHEGRCRNTNLATFTVATAPTAK
jgi:hypothetical protein